MLNAKYTNWIHVWFLYFCEIKKIVCKLILEHDIIKWRYVKYESMMVYVMHISNSNEYSIE